MYDDNRLTLALFFLRLTVFGVMLLWTIDKFINPDHAVAVYARFYAIEGLDSMAMTLIGIAELIVLGAFLLGLFRTLSYGAVLVFHAVSTLSSYEMYLTPFADYHLLFFTAWPMLAACLALFMLREADTLFTLGD